MVAADEGRAVRRDRDRAHRHVFFRQLRACGTSISVKLGREHPSQGRPERGRFCDESRPDFDEANARERRRTSS